MGLPSGTSATLLRAQWPGYEEDPEVDLGKIPNCPRGPPPSRVVQPALQDRVLDDVDPPGQIELSHRVGLVRLDGLDAERQLRRDFLVAVLRRDQAKHRCLPLGQGRGRYLARRVLARQSGGDSRRQRRIQVLTA